MSGGSYDAPRRFWSTDPPRLRDRALAAVLAPAALGFAAAARMHRLAFDRGWLPLHSSAVPVVSVGGLEVGGVGKTPLVAELVRVARAAGLRPAVLTRGYGGAGARAPRLVPTSPALDGAAHFGDEPILLREQLGPDVPIWVARDRVTSARLAAEAGAELLILDDGFQHRRLRRDADLVCLSGTRPFGNGRILPLGPLREPPTALRRATRVVLSDVAPAAWPAARASLLRLLPAEIPIHAWTARPSLRMVRGRAPETGASVFLLTGVAHPERVACAVTALGLSPAVQRADPDHHAWTDTELRAIARQAGRLTLLTTAKDWVRLRPRELALGDVGVVEQRLEWLPPSSSEEWSEWMARLAQKR
ncbi:MAG: tetraacyldisaccharide 4'-kinase [Candidatus Eisenbacteria bacterium]